MIYLLDTQLVLWASSNSDRLPAVVRRLLSEETNGFMFSAAVIWEVAIKSTLGRPDFSADARLLTADSRVAAYGSPVELV